MLDQFHRLLSTLVQDQDPKGQEITQKTQDSPVQSSPRLCIAIPSDFQCLALGSEHPDLTDSEILLFLFVLTNVLIVSRFG